MTNAPAFPAPRHDLTLYEGKVMHHRMRPKVHRFSYTVYALGLDLDALTEKQDQPWLFSHNRFNLFSLADSDHGAADGSPLRPWVETVLAEAGVERPNRIILLCYPRLFGLVFNPLSVFFAYDAAGGISAVIYEVRNTFGERHAYVAPVRPDEMNAAGLRQKREKKFHVSPFMGVTGTYSFSIQPPGDDRIAVRILESDEDGPLLAATFHGKGRKASAGALLLAAMKVPLLTLKVVGGIHLEALKLWLKGIRFHTSPPPPERHSFEPHPSRSATPSQKVQRS